MIAKNKFLTVDRDLRRLASEIDDFTVVCFFFFFHGLSINRRYSKRYSIDRQRADTRTLISFFSPFLSLAKIDRWKSIKNKFSSGYEYASWHLASNKTCTVSIRRAR